VPDPSLVRLIPDCRVSVDGKKLDIGKDAALTRVDVDLDLDLFGQCVLTFNDPKLVLINGKDFASGTAVKVELGFHTKLQEVFEGEVVALEPIFRRDTPPLLKVVCQESLHRLALSPMTRSASLSGKSRRRCSNSLRRAACGPTQPAARRTSTSRGPSIRTAAATFRVGR